jgi:hypothetical protein
MTEDRTAAALERIATALEQMALEVGTSHRPISQEAYGALTGEPPLPTPPPGVVPTVTVPLPPVVAAPFQFTPITGCPVHHQPWKTVPAGVSKRTGNAYAAFQACPERDCNQRPPQ